MTKPKTNIALHKLIEIDGREYVLAIDELGAVEFAWYNKRSLPEPPEPHYFELFPEERDNARYEFGDAGAGSNALRVFSVVATEVVRWTKRHRPHMVHFFPCNSRRVKIYAWLAKRLAKALPEYNYYRLEDAFYFFRKAGPNARLDICSS